MKIVFTGGGTGGHFYPIIAVAEALNKLVEEEKILTAKFYYLSDSPYDKDSLFQNGIRYRYIPAGKRRTYTSVKNFVDIFKSGIGILKSIATLFYIYPDVVFSKGGYCAFPVIFAARILRIPTIIHESDTVPGRVNIWSGKFAKRIAVSYDEAAHFFPKERVAVTGQPVRETLREKKSEGAFEYLKLDPSVATILVLGGSQGAEAINNVILDSLPELLKNYQVIHQTGEANFDEVRSRAKYIVTDENLLNRYKPFPFLNPLSVKMSAGAASLVISRAGSSIFEIASWGVPSIIIPIPGIYSNGDHQRKNAFNYARHGAATVIEEDNLSPVIILSEVKRILNDPKKFADMQSAALKFATPNASREIAQAIVDISLSHEK